MKLTQWFSNLRSGRTTSPQDIFHEALKEKDVEDTSFARFIGEYEDLGFFAPVARLSKPSHFHTQSWINQSERANWVFTHPGLMIWSARFILHLKKAGIPAFAHSAFRTKEEQEEAFAAGHSKLKWPRAAHCQGKAVDIVHGTYAWNLTPMEWRFFGKIGKDIHYRMMQSVPPKKRWSLEWGGDWFHGRSRPSPDAVGWDPAHWEVKGWQSEIAYYSGEPRHMTPSHILSLERTGHIKAS